MGMFDSVYLRCPKCNDTVEVQSKAGECYLRTYDQDEVPTVIAADINGEEAYCKDCDLTLVVVGMPPVPATVAMRLVRR